MRLPSIQLDLVVEDHLSATRAEVLSTAAAPFALQDGQTLILKINGVAGTVTFALSAFADIGAATFEELRAAVAPMLAAIDGEIFSHGIAGFGVRSLTYGSSSAVQIQSGTANAALGLTPVTVAGANGGSDVLVANRNPQAGEVQVPVNADVEFDFVATSGSPPATNTFVVKVDGVTVWNASGFQNGRFGSVTSASPDAATIRFAIKGNSFLSGQAVLVEVNQGSGTFVTSWTFFAYDTIPPLLASVVAVNKDQIKVTFNETVTMVAPTIDGDALNPSSYIVERVSRPAATPAIAAVDRVSSTVVLLTTSFELTFGAQYMLVVTGISDEFDNLFEVPGNVADFDGWLPPFPAGRRFLLHDFVPAFTLAEDTTDELRLFLGCLQDTLNLLLHLIDKWTDILDPDLAPEAFLDAMLADLGNPFTFDLPTADTKRKLVKVLVRIYQLKGTVPGIIDVVRFFLGIEVTVEIFNGLGWRLGYDKLSSPTKVATPNPAVLGPGPKALYSFRVRTEQLLTDTQRDQISTIATYMKGAQEHLVSVVDGTVPALGYKYWKLDFTKLGYVKIATS